MAGALIASAALVGVVRTYALHRDVLDHPGTRSSHRIPTPRGGGAGLIAAWLVVLLASSSGTWTWQDGLAFGGLLLVAGTGWLDDHGGLSVRIRLFLQASAGCALLPLVFLDPVPAAPAIIVAAWWIFCAVASANVVNFIDGIDGLIGVMALVFGAFVGLAATPGTAASHGGWLLAAVAAGFLLWNWHPAKIFLGDVGSGAIGFIIVLLGILTMQDTGRGIIDTFLPLYPIVLDASATLVRRWRAGESLTEPHRTHLYQRLANGSWGHWRVSLLYGAASVAGAACALVPPQQGTSWPVVIYLIITSLGALLLARTSH